jgi:cyclophilin family peptidyl-prolyl cis-trans isomerase
VSRKHRRERKNVSSESAAPTPPADQPSGTPAATRPGAVFAIVAGLIIVVVGGGFLVYYYMQRGPGGPNPQVVMETSAGTIKIELFQRQAPISVRNFLAYVDEKFYDGTIFHRIVKNTPRTGIGVVQGGGFLPGMREKRGHPPITNEAGNGVSNERGTLAMARTSLPDSATSQFYINVTDNTALDRAHAQDRVGYAVFGKVIEGMDVVDKIGEVETTPDDVPVQDVIIKSVRRMETK